MVAKITTGKDIYGALFYNQEKVNKGQACILATQIIREPVDGNFHISVMSEEFLRWMPAHFRTEKPVIHISLNPHEDDNLSDEQFSEIAQKYLEQMGYGEQPYIVFKHTDIQREHIHIVSLQVDSMGKKIKDSKRNERSVAITEALEKEYGLIPAKAQRKPEVWELAPVDSTLGKLKKQVAAIIKPLHEMYSFQTMGEYRALLSFYNIGVEEVAGTRSKKTYRGLLYTVADRAGNKVATPLKSSLFGKDLGIEALEKRMRFCGEKIKKAEIIDKTRKRVVDALNDALTEKIFKEKLKNQNIDLFIRRNDTGRIVGVTFVDHKERCVLNGSRLGKEFSANKINERFTTTQNVGVELHGISDTTLQKKKNKKLNL